MTYITQYFTSTVLTLVYVRVSGRSAKEAEEKIKKALEKGEVLPTEARFDSNCITPGLYASLSLLSCANHKRSVILLRASCCLTGKDRIFRAQCVIKKSNLRAKKHKGKILAEVVCN